LAVFLACVGLQAGDHFIQRSAAGHGVIYLAWGLALTVIPVLLVGCVARWACKMNFLTLAGWVAGAMTSSPALLFAEELGDGYDAPALAYAAVAPLAMLGPLVCAQIMVAVLG
jgi:putative transport protein